VAVALAAGLFVLPMAPLPAASSAAASTAVSTAAAAPGTPASPASAEGLPAWADPLPGGRVTSPYGPRRDPLGGGRRIHTGIDVAAPRGSEIFAPAAGTVRVATMIYEGGAHHGTVVVVDHGGGLSSFYSHLDRLDVVPGQWVAEGQSLGTVGMTGQTTGAHLHFEVWRDGSPVDPARLVAVWRGC
jgi:murein DD-endopeptidase MepM/ murein hydrolase activator NlpD